MTRSLWQRVGGPFAVSLPVWLATAPISSVIVFFSSIRSLPDSQLGFLLLTSIVSYLPSAVVFALAWFTFLSPKNSFSSRPLLAILTFYIAHLTTGLMMSFLLGVASSTSDLGMSLTRAFIGTFWSTFIALIVDSRRRYVEFSDSLTKAINDADELTDSIATASEDMRRELNDEVKSAINSALAVQSRDELTEAADQIVRPLISQLRSKTTTLPRPLRRKDQKIAPRPVLAKAFLKPVRVPVVVAVVAAVNLTSHAPDIGLVTIANLAVLSLVIGSTLYLIRRLRPSAFLTSGFYGLGIGLSIATGELFQLFESVQDFAFTGRNVGAWVIAALVGFFIRFEIEQNKALVRLEATLAEIQWLKGKLEQELWVEKNRVLRRVHGNVQSKIRAAAFKDEEFTPSQIEQLRQECLAAIEGEFSNLSFQDFLTQTERVWEGVLVFNHNPDPVTIEVLDQDPYASAAAIETVREGVCNAVPPWQG